MADQLPPAMSSRPSAGGSAGAPAARSAASLPPVDVSRLRDQVRQGSLAGGQPAAGPKSGGRSQGPSRLGFIADMWTAASSKLPDGWYYWLIGAALVVGGYYYFQIFGMPNFETGTSKTLTFPGTPGLILTITLATVALLVDCLLGLAEAQNREDPGLLDWWIPYVVIAVLVWGQVSGTAVGWWWFAAGFAAASLIFATLWNPSDQEDPDLLDRVDTTAIFRTCFILGLLYFGKWASVPYPVFIPPVIVLTIGALALFKELMRTPKFALMVLGLGVVAAAMYTPWWIAGSLVAAVIMAAVGAHQGWIPGAAQKRTEVTVNVLGRKAKLILAWDVVIGWWATFILTATLLYHNPVIAVIGGG